MIDKQFFIFFLFFVIYIIFQFLFIIFVCKIGFRLYLVVIIVLWGVVMIGMGFVVNWEQMVGMRFFFGVLEVGFFFSVVYFLSIWYIRCKLILCYYYGENFVLI